MKSRVLAATAGLAIFATVATAQQPQTIFVISAADSGPGSLRAALHDAAATDVPTRILLVASSTIVIRDTLTYPGHAPLEIAGQGQVISSNNNVTLIAAPNGADLTLSGLSLRGPGGFGIHNRGDLNGPAGKGVFVGIPADATGDVHLTLRDVSVTDVAGHGVHIIDCAEVDDCGGAGSVAGLVVDVVNLSVTNVGHGQADADGLRADERGPGGITFTATGSSFTSVGADGVELDEGGPGDVTALITDTAFASNGYYCNPGALAAFLPNPLSDKPDDGAISAQSITDLIASGPDTRCVELDMELYRSGTVRDYEISIDLDDGIDLDEAGEGSIMVTMVGVSVTHSGDEGIDFDEHGSGDINATFIETSAHANTDDGIKMSEAQGGDVIVALRGSSAKNNGGKGFLFEEEDAGDLRAAVSRSTTAANDHGHRSGLKAVQEDAGGGTLTIMSSHFADGIDTDGVSRP